MSNIKSIPKGITAAIQLEKEVLKIIIFIALLQLLPCMNN